MKGPKSIPLESIASFQNVFNANWLLYTLASVVTEKEAASKVWQQLKPCFL